jgi:hypothetical protein
VDIPPELQYNFTSSVSDLATLGTMKNIMIKCLSLCRTTSSSRTRVSSKTRLTKRPAGDHAKCAAPRASISLVLFHSVWQALLACKCPRGRRATRNGWPAGGAGAHADGQRFAGRLFYRRAGSEGGGWQARRGDKGETARAGNLIHEGHEETRG